MGRKKEEIENKNSSPKKQKSKIKKFFSIVFKAMLLFVLFSTVALSAYLYTSNRQNKDPLAGEPKETVKEQEVETGFSEKEKLLNVLLLGVDGDQTRTDTMILARFNTKTKDLAFISIPRDTKIQLPSSMLKKIRSKNSGTPRSGIMKLNELHSYAYPEGVPYLEEFIEDMLNIKIDNYVKVNFNALHRIVDAIGGVEFYVPQRMKYYDPVANFRINLYEGLQTLDGDKAEELVRFRSYPEGDLKRVEVQQAFIKETMKQVLSLRNIPKIPSILDVLEEEVETDFNFAKDGLKYSRLVTSVKADNIVTKTLPGEPVMEGRASYVILDEEEARIAVENIFEKETLENQNVENEEEINLQKRKLKVEVLNGTSISGLANVTKSYLEEKGYEVISVGNYQTKGQRTTIIQSKSKLEAQKIIEDLTVGKSTKEIDQDVAPDVIRIVVGEDVSFLKN